MSASMSNEDLAARVPETPAPPAAVSPRGVRVALFVVLLLTVGLGGAIAVRVKQAVAKKDAIASERATAQASVAQKPPLATTHAVAMKWQPRVDVTGTLKPWREADVGFELGGRLVQLNALQGAKVRGGQTIAVLDASRAAAEVGVAEAQERSSAAAYQLAQDDLRRAQALFSSGSIPLAQLEETKGRVTLAKAALDGASASAKVARTGQGLHSITAPFDGIVTKAPTAAGSVVQPGSPLFHVEDLSHFRLSATLGEEDADAVKLGAAVKVVYRDRTVAGKLITMVPSLDQATRRAPIEIEVPNDPKDPLLGNGFVRATIEGAHELDAYRLPPNARRPGSQDEVVKVVGGKAQILHVPHAVDADGSWVVLRGVTSDDVIALNPADDVRNGDPIEVAPSAPTAAK
jgi:RND family efflux transporter MFP subunit